MSHFFQLAIVPLIVAILSACTVSDSAYFPLESGLWRYYETRTKILDDIKIQRMIVGVAGTTHTESGKVYVMRQAPDRDSFLQINKQGIFRLARRDRFSLEEAWDIEPSKILPLTPKLGDAWQVPSKLSLVESRTFARQDRLRNRTIPFTLEMRVVALDESLDVPAGKFHQCLKVTGAGRVNVRTDRGNANAVVNITQHDWYAPGVGLIKSERLETSDSPFLKPGSFVQALTATGSH